VYLQNYSRALARASQLAPDREGQAFWATAARDAIVTEMTLHTGFLRDADTGKAAPSRKHTSITYWQLLDKGAIRFLRRPSCRASGSTWTSVDAFTRGATRIIPSDNGWIPTPTAPLPHRRLKPSPEPKKRSRRLPSPTGSRRPTRFGRRPGWKGIFRRRWLVNKIERCVQKRWLGAQYGDLAVGHW